MDQQSLESLQQGRKVMESDFDLDFELDFKPVTKGLGFHHKEKRATPRTIQKSESVTQKVLTDANIYTANVGEPTADFDLSLLYGESKQPEVKKITPEVKEIILIEADLYWQMVAFVIDFAIVTLLLGITSIAFFTITTSSLSLSSFFSFVVANIPFWSVLAGSYFVIYFSVLDVGVTPGKSFLKLSVKGRNGKRLSFKSSVTRSVVTLLSFIAIGVPLLFDFQGKLSDSIVVKD